MNITERIKNILLKPKEEWPVIDTESTTVADLYKTYIVPLAAIGPVASIIGMSVIGISVPFAESWRVPITTSITSAVISYVLNLAGVYVLALVVDALAPTFSGQKNNMQALKVVAYAFTAAWLAGVFQVIPMLAILGIVGLYSLYLLYLGLPVLMKVPPEKALGYTITVIVAGVVVFVVIGVVSSMFIRYPGIP
jgi:hypothetical protein